MLAVAGHFVDDVSVGSEHTLALTCDGDVWSWGSNSDGQLGLGHNVAVREPQLVGGLGRNLIKQVLHTSTLTSDGQNIRFKSRYYRVNNFICKFDSSILNCDI